MAGEVAQAFVRIRPKMDGFSAETETGVKKAFKHVAEIAGAALATEKLFDFGKDIVKSAAQVQKSTEQIKAGFGEASDSVLKFNENAAKIGLSAAAGEQASAKFSLLFDNMGIGEKKSAQMTIGFEKLATSLASVKGVDPSEVIDKFTAAAAGSTRGLKSLGIVIDANAIKQEAARLGLLKTAAASDTSRVADLQVAIAKANLTAAEKKYGDNTTQVASAQIALQKAQAKANAESSKIVGTLTPAAKAQAIYALATKNLGELQKQAATHSGDLVDVQRRLSASWSNIKDELGAKLLPVVARVGGFFADNLPRGFELARSAGNRLADVIRDRLAEPFENLRNRAQGVADKLRDMLPSMDSVRATAEKVADALKAAVDFTVQWQNVLLPLGGALGSMTIAFEAWTIATEVWTTVTTIATAAQEAFNIAMDANIIGIIVLAIIGLVGALVVLYQRSQTVRDAINAVWFAMRAAAEAVWGFIGKYVIAIMDNIKENAVLAWNIIRVAAVTAWNLIRVYVTTYVNVIRDVINIFLDALTGKWGKAWNDIKKLVSDVLNGIVGLFRAWWHGFLGLLDALGDDIEAKSIRIVLKVIEPFTHLPGYLGGGWAQRMKRSLTDALDGLVQPAGVSGTAVGQKFGGNLSTAATTAVNGAVEAMKQSLEGLNGLIPTGGGGATPHGNAGDTAAAGRGSLTYKAGVNMEGENAMIIEGLKAVAAKGYQVLVTSGFRTFAEQAALYARYVKSGFNIKYIAARPGHGMHESGLAADVYINGQPVDKSAGALAIFRKYGLVADVKGDHEHLDLLGYGGGGGGGGGNTSIPDLTVGSASTAKSAAQRAAEKAAALKKQIADQRKALKDQYDAVAKTAKELGNDMSKQVKAQMNDVRSDISHIASKADVKKAKDELGDLHDTVVAAVKKMKLEIELNKTFDSLKKQVAELHGNVTPAIKAEMKQIQGEIGNVATPKEIAQVKAQMAKVKNEVAAGLAAVKARLAQEKGAFEQAWTQLATGANNAFDRATQRMLRDLQITVTTALGSFRFGGDISKTPAEQALAELQDAHDTASAAAQLAADKAQLAADQASGDQAAIAASTQKVADDLYAMRVAELQKQAQVERDAATQQLQDAQAEFQQQRDLLKQQMDERVALIEQGMEDGTITAASGMKQLTAIFNDPAYGIDIKNSGLILGGNLYAGLSESLAPVFALIKRLQDEMRKAGIKLPGGGTVPGGGGSVSVATPAEIAAAAGTAGIDPAILAALGGANADIVSELQKQTAIAELQLQKPTSSDTSAIAFAARR